MFPLATFSRAPKSIVPSSPTTPKCAEIQIEGISVRGVSSDIMILSESAFQGIVTMNNLKKENFKPADRKACTYGYHPLNLDRQIDLHNGFANTLHLHTSNFLTLALHIFSLN